MHSTGLLASVGTRAHAFEQALLAGDAVTAGQLLTSHPGSQGRAGTAADLLVEEVVAPALVAIGEAWDEGRVSLSDVYLSGRMCQRVMEQVGVALLDRAEQPRIAVAVLGDSHVLGKTLVLQVLRAAGYRVSDWGAALDVTQVVQRAIGEEVDVLMLSVLMLRSALDVSRVRAGLRAGGRGVVLVVGGAPFRLDPGLAAEVGADHVGVRASDVLSILTRIEATR